MRPRKRVLLYAVDEARASLMRFRLETREGLRVLAVSSRPALEAALDVPDAWHVLLHLRDAGDADDAVVAAQLAEARVGETVLLEAVPLGWPADAPTQAHRQVRTYRADEICEAVRIGVARKRGPKPVPRVAVDGRLVA